MIPVKSTERTRILPVYPVKVGKKNERHVHISGIFGAAALLERDTPYPLSGLRALSHDSGKPEGDIPAGNDKLKAYGAPVLPGAMFLLEYFDDGMPVTGLPGCGAEW